MKRASLIGVLAMALAAGPGLANTRSSGFGFSSSTGSSRAASPAPRTQARVEHAVTVHRGASDPLVFHRDHGIVRHHFHRGIVVAPFAWGYVGPYPYYYYPYGYSPDYYYSAPYAYSPYTVYDSGSPPPAAGSSSQQPSTYYQLGHDWGQDLRQDVVTWAQFVDYLKNTFPEASSTKLQEFRRGFLSSYGMNAVFAFDRALSQAGLVDPSGPQ